VNAADMRGRRALLYAIGRVAAGDTELVDLLLSYGAEVDFHYDDGATPLLLMTQLGFGETVKYLLDNGADPNLQGTQSITPLMMAAVSKHGIHGSVESVQLLLDHGANLDSKMDDGRTVFDVNTSPAIAEILEKARENGRIATLENDEVPIVE